MLQCCMWKKVRKEDQAPNQGIDIMAKQTKSRKVLSPQMGDHYAGVYKDS